jgi:hypothetical protein
MVHPVKKTSIVIMTAIFIAVICLAIITLPSKAYANGVPYDIGDTGPAGGIIIFVDGDLRMEVAPSDQSTGIQWYNGTYITIGTGMFGEWIGYGDDNTEDIVNTQGAGSYAAKICDDLVLGGYDDWFLPSLGSMYWIYEYHSIIPGLDLQGWYWSSSEYAYPSDGSEANAWQRNPFTGTTSLEDKADSARVRAVRFFEVGEEEEENGNIRSDEEDDIIETPWVRDVEMTCYQVWINENNNFEFVFWWEYKNNNWVKIYDMEGSEVFSIDMEKGNARFEAELPDGMYTVRTFHDGFETPIQEFIIGKP